ncbi:hypothetical protein K0M31_001847 [Melipona bicolor]|uniref:Uncharacterized protein n=1 Tax=Melipona bicolor TaxID=60889 RepID=A0AA40GHG7_9HYME|nr:hypothetical protein K0M31_001847 [Melipona bicolor]
MQHRGQSTHGHRRAQRDGPIHAAPPPNADERRRPAARTQTPPPNARLRRTHAHRLHAADRHTSIYRHHGGVTSLEKSVTHSRIKQLVR